MYCFNWSQLGRAIVFRKCCERGKITQIGGGRKAWGVQTKTNVNYYVCIYSIIRGKGTTLKWWIQSSEETFYLFNISITNGRHQDMILSYANTPGGCSDQIIHPIWIRRKFTLNQTCWSNFLYLIKVREHGIWSVRMVRIWKIATKKVFQQNNCF